MANLHASWDSCFSSFLTDQGGREVEGRAGGGAAQGDLCGALLALPVLLGQVHALQTLLLLRLLLPLLLVVTLKPLTTLVDGPQPQSSAVASVLALALLDRSSTISC